MKRVVSTALLFLALPLSALAAPGLPQGWFDGGTRPQDYEIGTAPIDGVQGRQAAYIKAKSSAQAIGFSALTQCFRAEDYLGKRVRFGARVRTVSARAVSLFMRVDAGRNMAAFYNTASDPTGPISGTAAWQRRDIVLDVPAGSNQICYGVILTAGTGEVWIDGVAFEPVEKNMPVSQTPKAPVNLGFDQ